VDCGRDASHLRYLALGCKAENWKIDARPAVGGACVARGKKFLGRKTNQGPVAYLALEEKRDEVRKHFTDLGVEGNEEIYLHCAAAPQDAVPALIELVKKHKPALVIIDPLLRLIRLSDANDYASVTMALEPLLSLAREHKTHIVLVHHLRKGQSADAAEAILGSTAFHGAVDSAILMQRTEHFRTIQTSQRYGRDLPECVLDFDEQRRSMTLGVLREEADVERVCAEIVKYLEKSNKGMTQEQIENDVTGRTGLKRAALRSLVKEHRILRTGSGVKGGPLLLRVWEKGTSIGRGFVILVPGVIMRIGTRIRTLLMHPNRDLGILVPWFFLYMEEHGNRN